ncbi:septal ring lytic transglycosylase RlpA family protein [Marinifilum sp.]|uniref:septal ring lytic transglycosylase RlpA family protein n=1 Tax=Marinifilum sp. TaxID=2033137 RepID=UPI003BAD6E46
MKLLGFIMALIFLSFAAISQDLKEEAEAGKASFYSKYFEGRKTASGEIFRQNKFTAAHKSLPFGTWVKVINMRNKCSVIVCINDRGPFVKGRIIDLSKSAARKIGNLNEGVFQVEIKIYQKDTIYIKSPKKSATLRQRSPYLDFSLIIL